MKKLLCLFLSMGMLLQSCVKNTGDGGNKKSPTFEVFIEGSLNKNFKIEGGCDKIHAVYTPVDLSYTDYRAIVVQGFDGKQIITVTLYWKGAFPTNPVFDFDINNAGTGNWGWGVYHADVNNPNVSYNTLDNGSGSATITSYEQSSQTVSGTFKFTAELNNNGASTSSYGTFSGTFTNVPINDLSDPNNPKGPCYNSTGTSLGSGSGSTGGTGGTGNTSNTTITYINNGFTPIDIIINGTSKTIASGGSVAFTGPKNSSATGTAVTSGKTSSGTQVGLQLSWALNNNFPASGNQNLNLNVTSEYFYLKIINNSAKTINKVYVNYNLQSQTVDNITLANDGKTYGLGYYKAYSNSNVRAESGTSNWTWATLSLPFTNNQSTTLTAIN